MVLDFIDVVVHVFEPSTRVTYDLELLWGDAPRVDWSPDRAPRAARSPR
jgi:ribosome-associated protein